MQFYCVSKFNTILPVLVLVFINVYNFFIATFVTVCKKTNTIFFEACKLSKIHQ